jgi:hypothetical protein
MLQRLRKGLVFTVIGPIATALVLSVAAVAAALKQAGEEAEAKTLIRLGSRELAR